MDPTTLPHDIILEINDHLDIASRLAFKLTHPLLYHSLPPWDHKRRAANSCCLRLCNSYLHPEAGKRRCALCKERYSVDMFTPRTTIPRATQIGRKNIRGNAMNYAGELMVEMPGDFCCWEPRRLVKVLNGTEGLRRYEKVTGGWYSSIEKICTCCHALKDRDTTSCKKALCKCNTCGLRGVRIWVRKLDEGEAEVMEYRITREQDGEYWAEEWSGSRKSKLIPVVMLDV